MKNQKQASLRAAIAKKAQQNANTMGRKKKKTGGCSDCSSCSDCD